MNDPRNISISDYDYNLPDDRIAQYPPVNREDAKLLIYNKGITTCDLFKNIDKYIPSGTLLVFNNTKVIKARLLFKKTTGANIEILCIEPVNPPEYDLSFCSKEPVVWKCIVGNLKKWKNNILEMQFQYNGNHFSLNAEKISTDGEAQIIKFSWQPASISFGELIDTIGHTPLPPYIKRPDTQDDSARYQTVYSKIDGSVAAPTAGLHFTNNIINSLKHKGIKTAEITLHVGAGTFKPVKAATIAEHEMHCEHFIINRETIKTLIENAGKIIAVGTTSVRTMESLYWLGIQLYRNKRKDDAPLFIEQWTPYDTPCSMSTADALTEILNYLVQTHKEYIEAITQIMIVPGYDFKLISGIITNFHLPKSTLLLLLAAWTGEKWHDIYRYALDNNFRFLSYGDSSLLLKENSNN